MPIFHPYFHLPNFINSRRFSKESFFLILQCTSNGFTLYTSLLGCQPGSATTNCVYFSSIFLLNLIHLYNFGHLSLESSKNVFDECYSSNCILGLCILCIDLKVWTLHSGSILRCVIHIVYKEVSALLILLERVLVRYLKLNSELL